MYLSLPFLVIFFATYFGNNFMFSQYFLPNQEAIASKDNFVFELGEWI